METKKKTRAKKVKPIIAYKAFDKDLKCRGFQYAIGETYKHDGEVKACESGFHSCENPLDVLNYYPLIDDNGNMNRFAVVDAIGSISKHGDDSKLASAEITIKAELMLPELVKVAIKSVIDLCSKKTITGYNAQQASSGYNAQQASSGNYAKQASSGYNAQQASSGDNAKQASSGDNAKQASSGNYAKQASSGNYAKQASSGDNAKQASSGNYAQQASSGNYAKQASSGDNAKQASSGDNAKQASSGKNSIIVNAGLFGSAKIGENGCIVLSRWVESEKRYRVSVGYEGENIKRDTWYRLNDAGEFVEVVQ